MTILKTHKKQLLFFFFATVISFAMSAQVAGWKPELVSDSKKALKKMMKDYPSVKKYYDKSYGYAVFPKLTKAGFVLGGAGGKGIVFKNHKSTGESRMSQATFGLQAGGQQYSEVIFFENKEAYDHFTNGKLKFDGQASAVALDKGVSADVAYKDGVAVFTQIIGGLMAEASLGGQHFTFKPKK